MIIDKNPNLSCDLVVVGSGVSGLTSAVQAAELGLDVIVLESCKRVGGNWEASYGMMAVDSPLSKEKGIHVDARALVNQEIRLFNYQVDSRIWMELSDSSGDNVEWLMSKGVEFNPDLEPYTAGDINAPVFHRWALRSFPSAKMRSALESIGGKVLTETKATHLVMKDGKVAGIQAQTPDGEIEIKCRAVISAGGGYAKNPEMVSKVIGMEDYAVRGPGANDGSSIKMCIEAGAKSLLDSGAFITDLIPRKMKRIGNWMTYIHSRPGSYPFHVSVNQDGERYVNEACSLKLYAFAPASAMTQEKTYTIYDDRMLQRLQEVNDNTVYNMLKKDADEQAEGICRADSFEELGKMLGLDSKKFAGTMERYNRFCQEGRDTDFEKETEFLQPFINPPFYGWENSYQVCATLAGVDYNTDMEVLSEEKKPIPGLYAAGCDGAKIWKNYYSLAIPGSCNSNNVYSGRKAAKSAAKYIANAGR